MKKTLFVLGMVFLVAAEANALDFGKDCPKDIVCSQNEFLGDDGKCYSCDTPEKVYIHCMGGEKAHESCPNRVFSAHDHLNSGGRISYLDCPNGTEFFIGEHIEYLGNCPQYKENNFIECHSKCPEGFSRVGNGDCIGKIDGKFVRHITGGIE